MRSFAALSLVALLAACSSPSPDRNATDVSANGQAADGVSAPVKLTAPAGEYKLDPNHSSLFFRVTHLGLSNYVVRFTDFDATLKLDPANPSASSVTINVRPASIAVDFSADYKATHKDSKFKSWTDELANSPDFLNAGKFPEAKFQSTKVELTGEGTGRVTGDLTLLGQTHPVTFDVKLVGSAEKHPFLGGGAFGLTATGSFDRSAYGIKTMLEPPLVSDKVALELNSQIGQGEPKAAPAAPAG